MQNVVVQVSNPVAPEAYAMIEQLDCYLGSLYPAEHNYLLSVQELQQPSVTFLTASVSDEIVGCGALVNQDGAYGEVKRMFVLPAFRGLSIGRRLLDELEGYARGQGLTIVRMETGIYQPEALRLFEWAGYQNCEPFGTYSVGPFSVFLEKQLG
jgi:putative acetyltransferase